jgi:hypothetical protein
MLPAIEREAVTGSTIPAEIRDGAMCATIPAELGVHGNRIKRR